MMVLLTAKDPAMQPLFVDSDIAATIRPGNDINMHVGVLANSWEVCMPATAIDESYEIVSRNSNVQAYNALETTEAP